MSVVIWCAAYGAVQGAITYVSYGSCCCPVKVTRFHYFTVMALLCNWTLSIDIDIFIMLNAENVLRWQEQAAPSTVWAFNVCPLENECTNGHHTCTINEQCIDADVGFNCKCKTGYQRTDRCD